MASRQHCRLQYLVRIQSPQPLLRKGEALTEATALSKVLDIGTQTATWMFNQVTNVGNAIVSDGVLSVGLGIFVAGAAIGVFSRLLRY